MTGLTLRTARGLVAALTVMGALIAAPPRAGAESGFTGLQIQGMSLEIAQALGRKTADGVLVRDVALGGPADQAGIRRGDLILNYAGQKIDSFERMVTAVGTTSPGKSVQVSLVRAGNPLTLTLTPGQWTEPWKTAKSAVASLPASGLTLATLTQKLRKGFGLRWGSVGVVVTLVDPDRTDIPLRRGDLIAQINLEDVWQPSQVIEKYEAAKKAGQKQLLVLIERVNGFHFTLLPVR